MAWQHDKNAGDRGYGHRWRKLREVVLARDPVCRVCGRAPSASVDHIVPKARGGDDAVDNLQGICDPCHDQKTAADRTAGTRVHLLFGPPGSGRRAYVEDRRGPDDLVVDVEAITASYPPEYAESAIGALAQRLASDARRRAWIIAPGATVAQREAELMRWGAGESTTFRVPAEACIARLRGDPARRAHAARLTLAVDDWWRMHGP